MSLPDPLSYKSNNATVSEFDRLVKSKLNESNKSKAKSGTSIKNDNSSSTELDKNLYNTASSLPEADAVSLDKSSNANKQYVYFNGRDAYKETSNGFIKDTSVSVLPQYGWIITRPQTPDTVLFNNEKNTFFVKLVDTIPTPITTEFKPLYDALKKDQYFNDDSIMNDLNKSSSLATTIRNTTSSYINNDSGTVKDIIKSNVVSKIASTGEQTQNGKPWHYINLKGSIYPRQIWSSAEKEAIDSERSVYNNIQAVIYDLPGYIGNSSNTIHGSMQQLLCYQQPDSVSYSSTASYEPVSPRGSQQPFQFYQSHNAMELSFTLKWHIDEIRTLAKNSHESYTMQDIAQIAEDFTRPWSTGDSIHPKLCKVILPGISQIGYITSATIQYSGDMSGDYTTNGGVLTGGSNDSLQERKVYNYFYSQIEVNFSMIIVKDILLWPVTTSSKGMSATISAAGKEIEEPKNKLGKQEEEVKNTEKDKVKKDSAESNFTPANGSGEICVASENDKPNTKNDNMCIVPPKDNNGEDRLISVDEHGQNERVSQASA
jgi:hypothetical protein